MEFSAWCAKVRAAIVAKIGEGGDAICGTDQDMRDYFDDGYTPDRAARELMGYYAEAA